MRVTVQQTVYHGADVIKLNLVPIGNISEEAHGIRKINYRFYREKRNTRKISRICVNADLFNI